MFLAGMFLFVPSDTFDVGCIALPHVYIHYGMRWFGHVQRREEEDCVRRILEADVHGQRSRGRQRKRWIDVVKYNMEDLRLDPMDVENRAEWRRRTRVADPSPEGFTA